MTNTLHAWSRNTRANPIQKVFCDIKSVLLFSLMFFFSLYHHQISCRLPESMQQNLAFIAVVCKPS